MREITIQKDDHTTVKITSPWLNIDQASNYLCISRSEFLLKTANNVPCKGFGKRRIYHVDELDKCNPEAKQMPGKKNVQIPRT